MTQSSSQTLDPLYQAIVVYEQAENDFRALSFTVSGAYRGLTDAIRGHGSIEDARYRFSMEAALLSTAHDQWKVAAAALAAQVEDGEDWQAWFMRPRRRCPQCGNVEVGANRWLHDGGCNECFADGADRAAHAQPIHGDPFEEVARQSYGERGVVATEDI